MKVSLNRLKIGSKFMLASSILITLVVLVISLVVNNSIQELTQQKVTAVSKQVAHAYANIVDARLEEALNNAELLADVIAEFVNNPNIVISRREVNKVLRTFLQKHENYVGVALAFEPDAFDGKDREFVNLAGHDDSGRFVPYWSRDMKGQLAVEPLVGYDIDDWYRLPKQSHVPEIIDPYLHPMQGKVVLVTSLIVPMLTSDGRFLGVVGIDLSISQLADAFEHLSIQGFDKAYVTLYSEKGLLVGTSSNGTRHNIGRNLKDLEVERAYYEKIMLHETFTLTWHSSFLNEPVLSAGFPIEIGNNQARWMVSVNIPIREINAQARAAFWAIMLIGGSGVGLALLLMFVLTRRLLQPLRNVRDHLQLLSQGQPSRCSDINYRGHDEIAELVKYAHQLKSSILDTIGQAESIAKGDYSSEIKLLSKDDQLGLALSKMLDNLQSAVTRTKSQDWLKTGQTELNARLSGEQTVISLSEHVINFLVPYLDAQVGAVYLIYDRDSEQPYLKMIASHAYTWRKHGSHEFKVGEGLVGQAALERKTFVIAEPPDDYLYIQTGLGSSAPKSIVISPFLYEGELKGVLEIASVTPFTDLQVELLKQVTNSIAIAVNSATSRTVMKALLEQTQLQADEMEEQTKLLQRQQAELQQANEELQSQSEELQTQQEELRQANDELQSRTVELERQRLSIQEKNRSLESARTAIELKAQELELASRYKSEFLANMSHELRTPLNSLLILAQLLLRNTDGNLTDKQLEYAQTIHSAGADLLTLINEILDLSKVEAGHIEVNREPCPLEELLSTTEQKFRHVAEDKGLSFNIVRQGSLPEVIHTDPQRLKQIINNLLSNAFKFTDKGEVNITITRPSAELLKEKNLPENDYLVIHVKDSGIGIPEDKQAIIFEAFQQADGTTSRRYGGTGLGLAISRQLSRLLGGDLFVTSKENEGSTFTLILLTYVEGIVMPSTTSVASLANTVASTTEDSRSSASDDADSEFTHLPDMSSTPFSASVGHRAPEPSTSRSSERDHMDVSSYDDREILHPQDKTVLIMEDDRAFASMLMELAHEKGFKCIWAEDGNTGLQLVDRFKPDAIVLDVGLPRIDGLTVMERIKDNPATRHIPVHFISGSDEGRDAKRMGAIGYLLKPVSMGELTHAFEKLQEVISQSIKHLLVLVDNDQHQQAIDKIIESNDVERTMCQTVSATLAQLKQRTNAFDAIVLDVDVEKKQGLQLLPKLAVDEQLAQVPVILYANRDLTEEEEQLLQRYEDSLTVKSVASPERLLDEVTLFMHQISNTLSEEKQQMLRMVHDKEAILAHKKVLLVDDDMRNTFALMTVLEDKDMDVSVANNGLEALAQLKEKPDMDLVLMDIMMPEMDGYETMRAIRKQQQFRKLPIIALTAKAMKDDKAKCIEAGANDYLTKPVDIDKLLSLMRVWLYK